MKLKLVHERASKVVAIDGAGPTVGDLKAAVAEAFGIRPALQSLFIEAMPKPLVIRGSDTATLASAGVKDRQRIRVQQLSEPHAPATPARSAAPAPGPASSPYPDPAQNGGQQCPACTFDNAPRMAFCEMCGSALPAPPVAPPAAAPRPDTTRDEELAAKLAASLNGSPGSGTAPTSPMVTGTRAVMTRRRVPPDNSCLFHAVGYLLEGRRANYCSQLRRVVMRAIADNPGKYTAAVLGEPVDAYVARILHKDTWGGGIELGILSMHYKCEIVAADIESMHLLVLGAGMGFTRKAYLLYSGKHYDAIVRAKPDGKEKDDERTFRPDDQNAAVGALQLAARAHKATANAARTGFNLQCLICGVPCRGQGGAGEHAAKTGHVNFSELGGPASA